MSNKTKNGKKMVVGKIGAMKPFTYKEVYLNKVEKVSSGVYNYETFLDGEVILSEENLKKKTMFLVGDYIREKIDEYEMKNNIETTNDEAIEIIGDKLIKTISDEKEEMQEAIDEVIANEMDSELDEEEKLMKQFEEETGKSALTTKGTLRKDYVRWKKDI